MNLKSIDHRSVMEQILELEEELQRKQIAIDRISFINSHEVRRPVTNILGLVNIIDTCEKDLICLKPLIGMLKESADELDAITRMINELLSTLK